MAELWGTCTYDGIMCSYQIDIAPYAPGLHEVRSIVRPVLRLRATIDVPAAVRRAHDDLAGVLEDVSDLLPGVSRALPLHVSTRLLHVPTERSCADHAAYLDAAVSRRLQDGEFVSSQNRYAVALRQRSTSA